MRSLVMAALVTVGCGSSGAGTTESCVDMSKAVSQRHGACKIPSNSGVGFGGCPALSDAYCQPDGLLSSCPSGWNTNCEMTGANCTYGDSTACVSAVIAGRQVERTIRFPADRRVTLNKPSS